MALCPGGGGTSLPPGHVSSNGSLANRSGGQCIAVVSDVPLHGHGMCTCGRPVHRHLRAPFFVTEPYRWSCGQGSPYQVGTTGGGLGGSHSTPPLDPHPFKNWAKSSSGPLGNQKCSLAPSAPISLEERVSSAPVAPLKHQHHRGRG